jgi:predicted transcriptional regulator
MTNTKRPAANGPGATERDLIARFEGAFNGIFNHMREELALPPGTTVVTILERYWPGNQRSGEKRRLRKYAELRNFMVHERLGPGRDLLLPSEATVADIERLGDLVLAVPRAIPTFRRDVEAVSPEDSMESVLVRIHERDYSQFPVYDGQRFKGLLTENGITRWLSHHVKNILELVDLREVRVQKVLRDEEARENVRFVSARTRVPEVVDAFTQRPLVEAVLITASGKRGEPLQGIATRWDILAYLNDGPG